jgi:hypothetical protein
MHKAKVVLQSALQLYELIINNNINEYQDRIKQYKVTSYEIAFKHLYNINGIKACSRLCSQLIEPNLILLHYSMLGHRYYDQRMIKKMEKAYKRVIDTFEHCMIHEPHRLNAFSKKGPNKWYISTLFYWARHVQDIETKRWCLIKLIKLARLDELYPEAVSTKYIRALEWLKCFADVPDIIDLGRNKLMAYPNREIIMERIQELDLNPMILKNKFKEQASQIKIVGRTKSINFVGNP